MLDNMSFAQIKKNVDFIRSQSQKKYRPEIEVSGGVNKYTVKKFVGLDIERVSIGMLTHSSKALDLSLEITISQ
jgi:nicotinate-nucleotide pyrophosphorylase (carboxylating)